MNICIEIVAIQCQVISLDGQGSFSLTQDVSDEWIIQGPDQNNIAIWPGQFSLVGHFDNLGIKTVVDVQIMCKSVCQ